MSSRSVRGKATTPPQAAGGPSTGETRPPTAAEKARERKLRADPLADVRGPLFIDCKRCGSRIKLSPKSAYDPFHWTKHRERCLKRPAAVVKEMLHEARNLPSLSSSDLSSPPSSNASRTPRVADSPTPPLTPDVDASEDASSSSAHSAVKPESSPSPPPSPATLLPELTTLQEPDVKVFEDYLHRSRRQPTRLLPPLENWHDWSWSQLKPPVWVIAEYPAQSEPDVMDVDAETKTGAEESAEALPQEDASTSGGGSGTLGPDRSLLVPARSASPSIPSVTSGS